MNDSTPIKHCSKCGTEHPATLEFFRKKKRGKFGVYSICRLCEQAIKQRLRSDPEYLASENEYNRARDKIRCKTTSYKVRRKLKRQKQQEIVRFKSRQYYRKYYATTHGKEVILASCRRRRATKRNAIGSHTADDVAIIYKSQKGLCWWCGKPVGSDYHVDHRIALINGGSNNPENLCISCPNCNEVKGKKTPWEFNGRLL